MSIEMPDCNIRLQSQLWQKYNKHEILSDNKIFEERYDELLEDFTLTFEKSNDKIASLERSINKFETNLNYAIKSIEEKDILVTTSYFIVKGVNAFKYGEVDSNLNYFNLNFNDLGVIKLELIKELNTQYNKYFAYCCHELNVNENELISINNFIAIYYLSLYINSYAEAKLNKFMKDKLEILKATPTQPTPPQKEIEPIKWQKQSVLLAYLINELKTYGFIDEENIWAICEQIFVDKKGNPIKAETFTSMVKNYENNQTPDGTKGQPKKHTEITELIKTLKAISKEM